MKTALTFTHSELSNLMTACATCRMRDGSPAWRSELDRLAAHLRAARDGVAALPDGADVSPLVQGLSEGLAISAMLDEAAQDEHALAAIRMTLTDLGLVTKP